MNKLTENHKHAIRMALRHEYSDAMKALDLQDEYGGMWLRVAGEAWEAFKAVAGYPMEDAPTRATP